MWMGRKNRVRDVQRAPREAVAQERERDDEEDDDGGVRGDGDGDGDGDGADGRHVPRDPHVRVLVRDGRRRGLDLPVRPGPDDGLRAEGSGLATVNGVRGGTDAVDFDRRSTVLVRRRERIARLVGDPAVGRVRAGQSAGDGEPGAGAPAPAGPRAEPALLPQPADGAVPVVHGPSGAGAGAVPVRRGVRNVWPLRHALDPLVRDHDPRASRGGLGRRLLLGPAATGTRTAGADPAGTRTAPGPGAVT